MADVNISMIQLTEFETFKELNLKARYFKAVEWDAEMWQKSGLGETKFHRLVNSTKFWKKKLLEAFDDCNLILTLHSEASNKFLSSQQIVDDIVRQFPGIPIVSYNRFRNPRYLAIDFKDTKSRDLILENLSVIGKFEVLFLSWAPINANAQIRVHWLPKKIPITKISMALGAYFTLKFIRLDSALHASGVLYGCGVSIFEGKLKPNVTLDQVPHIMMVAGLEALVTIPTRQPLCLQCDTVGHIAAKCPVSYCRRCKKKMPKEHKCDLLAAGSLSYAQKVLGTEPIDDDQDDYDFESCQQVSQEEIARTILTAKRLNEKLGLQMTAEGLKKVPKVDGQAIKDFHTPVSIQSVGLHGLSQTDESSGSSLAVGAGEEADDMDVSETVDLSQASLLGDDYTVVQKKPRGSKAKDNKNKVKGSKVPVVASQLSSRQVSKPVTRGDLLAVVLSNTEAGKSVLPGTANT